MLELIQPVAVLPAHIVQYIHAHGTKHLVPNYL